jgi:hypothetical protein
MPAIYHHLGGCSYPQIDFSWTVSVGTITKPATVHFKTETDMIAYLHGHNECLNYQDVKENYKRIEKELHRHVNPAPLFPEWRLTLWQRVRLFFKRLRGKSEYSGQDRGRHPA